MIDTEVFPTLEENQKTYAKYMGNKEMLSFTPSQKADRISKSGLIVLTGL